jgi:hypothetical protein
MAKTLGRSMPVNRKPNPEADLSLKLNAGRYEGCMVEVWKVLTLV